VASQLGIVLGLLLSFNAVHGVGAVRGRPRSHPSPKPRRLREVQELTPELSPEAAARRGSMALRKIRSTYVIHERGAVSSHRGHPRARQAQRPLRSAGELWDARAATRTCTTPSAAAAKARDDRNPHRDRPHASRALDDRGHPRGAGACSRSAWCTRSIDARAPSPSAWCGFAIAFLLRRSPPSRCGRSCGTLAVKPTELSALATDLSYAMR
jgi:hypothetical protein